MTCTCHSYNWGIGETSERILKEPRTGSDICIDACIADTIARLWENNVQTLGCCCGHNRQPPAIVIHDQAKLEERLRIWNLIRNSGDARAFDLVSWTPVYYRPVYRRVGHITYLLDNELTITEFSDRRPNGGRR